MIEFRDLRGQVDSIGNLLYNIPEMNFMKKSFLPELRAHIDNRSDDFQKAAVYRYYTCLGIVYLFFITNTGFQDREISQPMTFTIYFSWGAEDIQIICQPRMYQKTGQLICLLLIKGWPDLQKRKDQIMEQYYENSIMNSDE